MVEKWDGSNHFLVKRGGGGGSCNFVVKMSYDNQVLCFSHFSFFFFFYRQRKHIFKELSSVWLDSLSERRCMMRIPLLELDNRNVFCLVVSMEVIVGVHQ